MIPIEPPPHVEPSPVPPPAGRGALVGKALVAIGCGGLILAVGAVLVLRTGIGQRRASVGNCGEADFVEPAPRNCTHLIYPDVKDETACWLAGGTWGSVSIPGPRGQPHQEEHCLAPSDH